jgi:hypothetical protein
MEAAVTYNPGICLEGLWTSLVRMAVAKTDIRTKHVLNICSDHYRYTNPFSQEYFNN